MARPICTQHVREGLRIKRCADEFGAEYTARYKGREVGTLSSEHLGRKATEATFIDVAPGYRGLRVGTALYEAAADDACMSGRTLISDETRSRYAEAFWQKQLRKGRAECHGKGGDVYALPWGVVESKWHTRMRAAKTPLAKERLRRRLDEMDRALPHPDVDSGLWGCRRFVLKPDVCGEEEVDLSALGGAGWTAKNERMYKAIKRSCLAGKRKRGAKTCERIAAATVNKHRKKKKRRE